MQKRSDTFLTKVPLTDRVTNVNGTMTRRKTHSFHASASPEQACPKSDRRKEGKENSRVRKGLDSALSLRMAALGAKNGNNERVKAGSKTQRQATFSMANLTRQPDTAVKKTIGTQHRLKAILKPSSTRVRETLLTQGSVLSTYRSETRESNGSAKRPPLHPSP